MDLQQRVSAFPQWHYQFDLNGLLTPIFDTAHINRHEQRRRYFFDRLVAVCGGSLTGKRVLDLGCNAGYWSLACIDAGCAEVVGVDGRQMHVDQANLVFEVKGVDPRRYRFEPGDLFRYDWSGLGQFDVVLCLGLLYHVARPVELFDLIAEVNTDLLVVDTGLSLLPGSAFEVKHESLTDPRHAVEREMILFPTRQAVLDLAAAHKYRTEVLALPPITDWTGLDDYRTGYRRAFIAAKTSSLNDLPVEHCDYVPSCTSWNCAPDTSRVPPPEVC